MADTARSTSEINSVTVRTQEQRPQSSVAVIHATPAGMGGLGTFAATAIAGVSLDDARVFALGAGVARTWSLPGPVPNVTWMQVPDQAVQDWVVRYSWLRWRSGRVTFMRDRHLARWAAGQMQRIQPQLCYAFTQIALEVLRWCRQAGVPAVLDNPNGHIRNFQRVYEQESARWCGKRFHGHPIGEMVERVEEEYRLAERIRVHSEWAKESMVRFGVAEDKIQVVGETLNLERFSPPARRAAGSGPLRVCYVGSLDLRKGFVYLLRAIRALGPQHIQLRIVGATGDRDCARLFERERAGLQVVAAPGDPIPAYHDSELFVMPSLEDGLGLVALEAQGCNLPVIVTEAAGAKEAVIPGETGWVIPAADTEALTGALDQAMTRRSELWEMGRRARLNVEKYADVSRLRALSDWVWSRQVAAIS
ncbi:MAG TPA: glycosyltransferase family 4 protein [Bryobacteraceae bacterium]|nr:glycosyltransferase family 4 protein [Bryobacteraceae bacterium]